MWKAFLSLGSRGRWRRREAPFQSLVYFGRGFFSNMRDGRTSARYEEEEETNWPICHKTRRLAGLLSPLLEVSETLRRERRKEGGEEPINLIKGGREEEAPPYS